MKRIFPAPRSGFTLIELLVGLTVAALALAAGFTTLATMRERGEHANEAARVMVGGAAQRALLMDWLTSARYRVATGQQFQGIDLMDEGKERDLLHFPTTAASPMDGAFTVVALYIDTDPETPERGLVADLSGAVASQPAQRLELVPQAGALRIRYLSGVPGQADWMDGWTNNGLPRGVELTIEPVAGDTLPTLLRLPLRVALGARW